MKIMHEIKLSTQGARRLRKNMTEAERGKLRGQQLGFRFRRQVVLGRYIVDFTCLDPKIIIEVDGSQHADNMHYDEQRTKWLESLGYRVLRYWNNDVLQQPDVVIESIWQACFDLPHPASPPSPPAGEGLLSSHRIFVQQLRTPKMVYNLNRKGHLVLSSANLSSFNINICICLESLPSRGRWRSRMGEYENHA